MGNRELTKEKLISLVDYYETSLGLLDLILNDRNAINAQDVQCWLDATRKEADKLKSFKKPKSVESALETDYDKEHYNELKMFDI